MDNVITLPVVTTLPISPERVIESLREYEWEDIIVVGHSPDGEFQVHSSETDKGSLIYMLEKLKLKLLDGTY